MLSRTCLPISSPTWPMPESSGEWTLTVDCHSLNKVTLSLSAAMLDMLELQCELESKCHHCIANAFFSIPLLADSQPWGPSLGPQP